MAMPFREHSVVDEREEFVRLAMVPGANLSELCRRFGIARSNGYKWLRRYKQEGRAGLHDQPRRPHHSPTHTCEKIEGEVLRVRMESKDAWGARKIARVMRREFRDVPALSTITEILRRHGKLAASRQEHPGRFRRFERPQPNDLWQMDFKGHFALPRGRCHPLTVLDDHSRYAVGLQACGNEQDMTVRERLITLFRCYGMPFEMLMDNGPPWGDGVNQRYTRLTVWLLRLGIRTTHGRPYHPQTQGKDERFHRTLNHELIKRTSFRDIGHCQEEFDGWRHIYNHMRPHEAHDLDTPATRYQVSPRAFPETLPEVEYWPGDAIRRVNNDGIFRYQKHPWRIGKAFAGQLVALRADEAAGRHAVYFCSERIAQIDTHDPNSCGLVDDAHASPTTPQEHQQINSNTQDGSSR
jgi:transposase InsO family protein